MSKRLEKTNARVLLPSSRFASRVTPNIPNKSGTYKNAGSETLFSCSLGTFCDTNIASYDDGFHILSVEVNERQSTTRNPWSTAFKISP